MPALAGLGSPHWAPDARGLITGLTRGTRREHLVRAALEAAAYQTRDVLDAMPGELELLRADGGMTANAWLMQFQADLLGIPVEVAAEPEQTALGAALLAGLAVGLWSEPQAAPAGARYEPRHAAGRSGAPLRRLARGAPPHPPLTRYFPSQALTLALLAAIHFCAALSGFM